MSNSLATESITTVEKTSEVLVQAIRELLNSQRIQAAKEMAAYGAKFFPERPWLVKADKVLNSCKTTSRPARDLGVDRRQEYAWLRENQDAYTHRWVALLEGSLIACADSFEEVMRQVSSQNLKARPLVHHIA